jgi:hypothetical protein
MVRTTLYITTINTNICWTKQGQEGKNWSMVGIIVITGHKSLCIPVCYIINHQFSAWNLVANDVSGTIKKNPYYTYTWSKAPWADCFHFPEIKIKSKALALIFDRITEWKKDYNTFVSPCDRSISNSLKRITHSTNSTVTVTLQILDTDTFLFHALPADTIQSPTNAISMQVGLSPNLNQCQNSLFISWHFNAHCQLRGCLECSQMMMEESTHKNLLLKVLSLYLLDYNEGVNMWKKKKKKNASTVTAFNGHL